MLRIGLGEPLRGLRTLQWVAHRCQRERCEIGLRGDRPGVADRRQRAVLSPSRTQPRRVGQRGRRQRWIVLPGQLPQPHAPRCVARGLRRGGGKRRLGGIGIGQRERLRPVARPHREPRPLAPQPGGTRLDSLGTARGGAGGLSPILAARSPGAAARAGRGMLRRRAQRACGTPPLPRPCGRRSGRPPRPAAALRGCRPGDVAHGRPRAAHRPSRRRRAPAGYSVSAVSPARRRRAACRSRSVRGRRIRAPSSRNSTYSSANSSSRPRATTETGAAKL